MQNYCTLFDSKYIDKGLALYYSLERNASEYMLYVLCMDEKTYQILEDLHLNNLRTVRLNEFETTELLKLKAERNRPEYCWTCTAASIEYMMQRFKLDNCTYIDTDLYFYSDPIVLMNEIKKENAQVGIMEHRFAESDWKKEKYRRAGKYCVEYNYFDNSINAQNVLKWWKEECFKWCYSRYEPADENGIEKYGDQKYLEQFPIRFSNVHVFENLGAGVAPWNLKQYSLGKNTKDNNIYLVHKKEKTEAELVFYHFQNVKYINKDFVNINSQCNDQEMKMKIYKPYLTEIESIRKMLKERYGLVFSSKKSYSSNVVKAFIQRNIMPYRLRAFGDIVNLKKLKD